MSLSRAISAVVAIIIALGMLLLGGWFFALAFGIIVYLGEWEYFELVRAKGINPAAKTTVVLSLLLLVIASISPQLAEALFPLAGMSICFYLLFQPQLATIADISTSILGLFYGGYLPTYWIRLRLELTPANASALPLDVYLPNSWTDLETMPQGLTVTLLAFGCIWAADIGAYIVGKYFGKTKLSHISPKKTVEGAVFGILGSVAVGLIGAHWLNWPSWIFSGAVLGLLIGVVSLLGDLTESMMKRDAGVKDSGQLIPGHGGVLDRTDSYVFTAPIVYYFVTLVLPWL